MCYTVHIYKEDPDMYEVGETSSQSNLCLDHTGKPFDWAKYLMKDDSRAAPAHLFLHLVSCHLVYSQLHLRLEPHNVCLYVSLPRRSL